MAKVCAERDGPATIAWAQSLAAGPARDDALRAALLGWAKSDPFAALEHLDVVPPNSGERYPMPSQTGWYTDFDIGPEVAREAARQDWDGTMQWLRAHPGVFGGWGLTSLSDVVAHRLKVDLGGTLRFFANSGIPSAERALDNALDYSLEQRGNVWQWLDEQTPTDFTRSLRGSLLWSVAWKMPDAAMELLEKLPDLPENRAALETGTRGVLNSANTMNRFDDYLAKASPKMRALLIETALAGYNDIGADAPLWAERIGELPADRQEKAIAGLARKWAAADPQAAVQWALAQPDPANHDAALNAAAKEWARGDLRDAAAWINAQPAGTSRDAATRGLVSGLAYNDPESAWTWALSIQTPAQKIGALQSAYEELRKKDFATAEHFLQNANLPPADVKAVREKARP